MMSDGHSVDSFLVACATPLMPVLGVAYADTLELWQLATSGEDPRASEWTADRRAADDEDREQLRRGALECLDLAMKAALQSDDASRAAAVVTLLAEWSQSAVQGRLPPGQGSPKQRSPGRSKYRRAAAAMAAAEAAAQPIGGNDEEREAVGRGAPNASGKRF